MLPTASEAKVAAPLNVDVKCRRRTGGLCESGHADSTGRRPLALDPSGLELSGQRRGLTIRSGTSCDHAHPWNAGRDRDSDGHRLEQGPAADLRTEVIINQILATLPTTGIVGAIFAATGTLPLLPARNHGERHRSRRPASASRPRYQQPRAHSSQSSARAMRSRTLPASRADPRGRSGRAQYRAAGLQLADHFDLAAGLQHHRPLVQLFEGSILAARHHDRVRLTFESNAEKFPSFLLFIRFVGCP